MGDFSTGEGEVVDRVRCSCGAGSVRVSMKVHLEMVKCNYCSIFFSDKSTQQMQEFS